MTPEQIKTIVKNNQYTRNINKTVNGVDVTDVIANLIILHPEGPHITDSEILKLANLLSIRSSYQNIDYTVGGRLGGWIDREVQWLSMKVPDGPHSYKTKYYLIEDDPSPLKEVDCIPEYKPHLKKLFQKIIGGKIAEYGGSPKDVEIFRIDISGLSPIPEIIFKSNFNKTGKDSFRLNILNKDDKKVEDAIISEIDCIASHVFAHLYMADKLNSYIENELSKIEKYFQSVKIKIEKYSIIEIKIENNEIKSVDMFVEILHLNDLLQQVRTGFIYDGSSSATDQVKRLKNEQKKALRALGDSQNPFDVYQACPVAARYYQSLSPDFRDSKYHEIMDLISSRKRNDENGNVEFRKGLMLDTVRLAENITFRRKTLMIGNAQWPETVFTSIAGKRLTDVCDHPYLEGLIIENGSNSSRNRVKIIVQDPPKLLLKTILENMKPEPKK